MTNKSKELLILISTSIVAVIVLLSLFAPGNARADADNFSYEGQELGVSTFLTGQKELKSKAKVKEIKPDEYSEAKSLMTETSPQARSQKELKSRANVTEIKTDDQRTKSAGTDAVPRKGGVTALYNYNSKGVLANVTITAPEKTAEFLFERLVKNSMPSLGEPKTFSKGNGIASVVTSPTKMSVITLNAAEISNAMHEESVEHEFIVYLTGPIILWFLIFAFWSGRIKMVDSFVAAAVLIVIWKVFNISPASFHVSVALLCLALAGCCHGLSWFIGAARANRYPSTQKMWHSFVAMPLAPFLVLPSIAKNIRHSGQYCGIVLFMAQLCGIIGFVCPKPQAYYFMAGLCLLSGGIVRLYAYTFKSLPSSFSPWITAILSNVLWPVYLLRALLHLASMLIKKILHRWTLFLFCAVAGLLTGYPLAIFLFGLVVSSFSLLLNAGAMGLSSTGYGYASSSDDFATNGFDFNSGASDVMWINPASGLPMMDGMGGVDVAGNVFGSDFSSGSFHDDGF